MVTVPTSKLQSTKVGAFDPGFQSSGSVPSGAFTNGATGLIDAGKKLGQTGDQLADLAIEMQNDDNDAEIKGGDNAIVTRFTETLYGDGTSENVGYYALERKAATDGYAPTEDTMRRIVEEVAGASSNDAVRDRLREMGTVRLSRALEGMTKHAGSERKKVFDEVSTSRIALAANNATLAWNDPKVMELSLATAAIEVKDYTKRHSLDKETATVQLQKAQSAVIRGAFDAALTNDAIAVAEGLLAKHGDKLEGAVKADMQKSLKAQSLAVKGQTLAASARTKYPNDPQAARQYIREVAEGKTEDEAISQFNLQVAEARGDKQVARTAETDRRALETEARTTFNFQLKLDALVEKTNSKDASKLWAKFLYEEDAKTPRTVRQFRRENPEEYDLLAGEGKTKRMQEEARNEALGQPFAEVTDNKTVDTFEREDIKTQAEADLGALKSKVTPKEWDELRARQDKAQKRIKRLKENPNLYVPGRRAAARVAQFPSKAKQSQKQKNMLLEVEARMDDYTDSIIDAEGRSPTQREWDEIAAVSAVQIVSEPWFSSNFSGLAVRKGRMTEAQKEEAYVPISKIPPALNGKIDFLLKNRGIDEIDDDVREEIAGAIAMGDVLRISALLKEAK